MNDYLLSILKAAKKSIAGFALATLIIMAVTFLIALILRPGVSALLDYTDIKNIGEQADSFDKFIQYIVNNGVKVPLQMFVFALIPVPFLYYAPVAVTAAITGFALYLPFSVDLHEKISFLAVILGIMPHALVEFTGFIVFLAALHRLNILIRHKLLRYTVSKEQAGEVLKICGAVYLLSFVILVIAAGIEAFITPLTG